MQIGINRSMTISGGGGWNPPNILANSSFVGAASGSPGTVATGWTQVQTGGTITVTGDAVNFTTSATRNYWVRTVSAAANTTYFFSILADVTTGVRVDNMLNVFSIPSGGVVTHFIDGASVAGSVIPSAGSRVLGARLVLVGTGGSPSFNFGAGALTGAVTMNATFSKPMVNVGGSRAPYKAT